MRRLFIHPTFGPVALAVCIQLGLTQAQAVNLRVLISTSPRISVKIPQTQVQQGQTQASKSQMGAWQVGVSGAQLTLNGAATGKSTLYFPPSPNSTVEIDGKAYRGGVFLRLQAQQVQAINVVDVEEYLRGVIASEMPASWPSEALQAQAVIARSYAAARISSRAAYDTCASESCQVYKGIAAEKPSTDAAIRATRGEVVSYQGKVAKTYFSSDSGGHTASSAEVWNNPADYLIAQPDPFSQGGPKGSWQLSIPLTTVQQVASRYGVRVGALSAVRVSKTSVSGRPTELTFVGSNGMGRIVGAEAGGFIRALGASSSLVRLSGLSPLIIQGSGNGHGVGLSQYGALGMAKAGYDHFHILGFYYPKTLLSRLSALRNGQLQLQHLAQLPHPANRSQMALLHNQGQLEADTSLKSLLETPSPLFSFSASAERPIRRE